ncbi:MAG TPA: hypothetical protein VFH68_21040 [Polyangia bacterium]|nr:hypothetical protein [Polyangia bacterium]
MIVALALGVPSSAHFIFIPVVLILGVVLGFIMGSKATRDAYALEEKKAAERLERAAKRAARHAAEPSQPGVGGSSGGSGTGTAT